MRSVPRVVLICHDESRLDAEGLASWLAHSFDLIGMVVLREGPGKLLSRARKEIRRSGLLGFMDVVAFRVHYAVRLASSDAAWVDGEVARLRDRYPAALDRVPRLIASSPNTDEVRRFLDRLQPDLMIARCKVLLRPAIFELPPDGTFVFHPGICSEYRNAHGCFWALSRRFGPGRDDSPARGPRHRHRAALPPSRLRVRRSPRVSRRDPVPGRTCEPGGDPETLLAVWRGERPPIPTAGRRSAVWGKPRLSAYFRWKRAAQQRTV